MLRASALFVPFALVALLAALLAVQFLGAAMAALDGIEVVAHEWARQAAALASKPV